MGFLPYGGRWYFLFSVGEWVVAVSTWLGNDFWTGDADVRDALFDGDIVYI